MKLTRDQIAIGFVIAAGCVANELQEPTWTKHLVQYLICISITLFYQNPVERPKTTIFLKFLCGFFMLGLLGIFLAMGLERYADFKF